jgi:hypothetical protein
VSRTSKPVKTDPRYRVPRWDDPISGVRVRVLARDGNRCWVLSCENFANVCDHIEPVYEGMPDALFFDMTNLRASCRRHNLVRGYAAKLEREIAGGVRPAPRRYSFGHSRDVKPDARGETHNHASEVHGFLEMKGTHDSALPKSLSLTRYPTVTRDYSRIVMQPAGASRKATSE